VISGVARVHPGDKTIFASSPTKTVEFKVKNWRKARQRHYICCLLLTVYFSK